MIIGLIVAIAILVLLLTGHIGGILIIGLKIVGWAIVAILLVMLLWKLITTPLIPFINWKRKRKEISDIEDQIKRLKILGYETSELEIQLIDMHKEYDLGLREMKSKLRDLGYDE